MYTIERTHYGLKIVLAGVMTVEEVERWGREFEHAMEPLRKGFGVFVDMRTLLPLPAEAQHVIRAAQTSARRRGWSRSVVIVDSAIARYQFGRIARETGVYEWERYIAAAESPDWEARGLAWICDGIDPDTSSHSHPGSPRSSARSTH